MTATIALKSENELKEVCDYIEDIAPSKVFVDLFKVGCNLALRISDLINLKYEDILEHDKLNIRMQKTSKYIQIGITDAVKSIVMDRRKRHPKDTYIFESDFRRYKGKPLTKRRVQQVFKEVAEHKMDGVKFSTHTMRKSMARIMWEKGIPLEIISEMLGHTNIKMTKRYLGLVQEDVDEAREKVQFSFM